MDIKEQPKRKRICAECSKWEAGEIWGTKLNGGNHGVVVECEGFCCRWKKKRRPTWNYHPACRYFDLKEKNGFIYSGYGAPTEEDLRNIQAEIEDIIESHKPKENNSPE